MRIRSSKRLAGCIAIKLALLAAAAWPADFRAGAANAPTARALVLEDARGNRAVFVQAEFHITQALADFAAGRLLHAQTLDRAGILFRWGGIGNRPAQPEDLVTAVSDALAALEPATVRYGRRVLSVAADSGSCLGTLNEDGAITFAGCGEGAPVTGLIRAAFQMVEPAHPLLKRGELARSFPVQAIALGKQVTILALSGEAVLPEGLNPRGLIFSPFSNQDIPPPVQDPRVRAAIEKVLTRVR
ncbi:MAG TPA: hypothetical protein VGF49_12655 [Candidatus Solibacter sp.]